jgi:acetyltransferase-like isoleucine patch superfamily enzyme
MRVLSGIRRRLDAALSLRRRSPEGKKRVPFMRGHRAYAAYEIGEGTYGDPVVLAWNEGTTLRIGRYCSIAKGVTIALGGEHRLDWVTTYPFSAIAPEAAAIAGHPRSKGDVVIGNDVWIGREALILSGVTIGNGAVIGARSVVARDVAPYSIVAGNPGRAVRSRFDERTIEQLEAIRWWDWPREKITEALPLLLSPRLDAFLEKYGKACCHDSHAPADDPARSFTLPVVR